MSRVVCGAFAFWGSAVDMVEVVGFCCYCFLQVFGYRFRMTTGVLTSRYYLQGIGISPNSWRVKIRHGCGSEVNHLGVSTLMILRGSGLGLFYCSPFLILVSV